MALTLLDHKIQLYISVDHGIKGPINHIAIGGKLTPMTKLIMELRRAHGRLLYNCLGQVFGVSYGILSSLGAWLFLNI